MFTYLYFIMVTKLFGFEINQFVEFTMMFFLAMEIIVYSAMTLAYIADHVE